MSNQTNPTRVVLRNVRMSFPHLTKPSQVKGEGKPAFSAAFILEKDSPEYEANVAALEAAMKYAAKEKWAAKAEVFYKEMEKNNRLALRDGDTKMSIEGYAGNMFLNARSAASSPPTLVRRDRSVISRQVVDGSAESDIELYGGCYVNVILNIWAQDNDYGKRINASLAGVQFYAQGVPFVGSPVANTDDFDELEPLDGEEGEDEDGLW